MHCPAITEDYTHNVQSSFGFSAEIDEMLTKAAIESSLVLKEKGLGCFL